MKSFICPGCGLVLNSDDTELDDRYNASVACRRIYDELSAFTLEKRDAEFIHQLAVDAYAAQHSGPRVKAISTAFALAGLYLTIERGFTGREVQRAHMLMARGRHSWPSFEPPRYGVWLTVNYVTGGLNPENYRERIREWGKSVWNAWEPEKAKVRRMMESF